jgi:hypothetical protein
MVVIAYLHAVVFAVAIAGVWWLSWSGVLPLTSALALTVMLLDPPALIMMMLQYQRRRLDNEAVRRHLGSFLSVFTCLFLLVLLIWAVADRRHALPPLVCVPGALGSSWVLLVLRATRARRERRNSENG